MSRSTTTPRMLAILFLGASISSGVLTAPTVIPYPLTSSALTSSTGVPPSSQLGTGQGSELSRGQVGHNAPVQLQGECDSGVEHTKIVHRRDNSYGVFFKDDEHGEDDEDLNATVLEERIDLSKRGSCFSTLADLSADEVTRLIEQYKEDEERLESMGRKGGELDLFIADTSKPLHPETLSLLKTKLTDAIEELETIKRNAKLAFGRRHQFQDDSSERAWRNYRRAEKLIPRWRDTVLYGGETVGNN
ncbi:hypothetical protein FB446DRAFT_480502 [Lentinula raphanica]|nr:hypothetical protein FB446DRAFT_480502 [Lentinula raphanica]